MQKINGTWNLWTPRAPLSQWLGTKMGCFFIFLLRSEIDLPWKINQIINKYLLKTHHHPHCYQLQQTFIYVGNTHTGAFLVAQMVKNPLAMWETWVGPWVGKICWRRAWQSTPVSLPGEFHWQRSLMGCRPWGHKKSDTTQRLSTAHNTHITQTWGERTIRFGLGHRGPHLWTLVGETRY